ncbi:MAG: asparagine synthetase B, partial [Caulobacteraceae bacterium]
MSAIGGMWRWGEGPDPAEECTRILAAQAIYGPHDAGQWAGSEAALGRRLWRLLPEDFHDRQPLVAADGRVLAADVRLDNRGELEAALGLDPAAAAGRSDAAILLAAWERWETGAFDRLAGDYAFALWDPRRRRLVLARDAMGHRPLHYCATGESLAFASMPKGLLALADSPPAPDLVRLAGFLALDAETGSRSFFEGVERVEPGCWLTAEAGGLRLARHWPPATRPRPPTDDAVACALRVRALLETAVNAHLRGAGATVGAHLSSGWDSGAVAGVAARLIGARGGRVIAFTAAPRAGYDLPAPEGRHGDEAPLAAVTAALHPDIEHVVVRASGRSPLAEIDATVFFGDRPVLNPCNQVWFDDIDRAARARGIKVMLTGDFGNLSFSDDGMGGLADLAERGAWRRWAGVSRSLARGGLPWRTIIGASVAGRLPGWLLHGLQRFRGRPRALGRTDYVA